MINTTKILRVPRKRKASHTKVEPQRPTGQRRSAETTSSIPYPALWLVLLECWDVGILQFPTFERKNRMCSKLRQAVICIDGKPKGIQVVDQADSTT